MKRDNFLEIVSFIGTIVLFMATIVLSISVFIRAKQGTETSKVYQIDTTKVQVLYEDTWGKILFVKEEDL